jgi:hypothetical protein
MERTAMVNVRRSEDKPVSPCHFLVFFNPVLTIYSLFSLLLLFLVVPLKEYYHLYGISKRGISQQLVENSYGSELEHKFNYVLHHLFSNPDYIGKIDLRLLKYFDSQGLLESVRFKGALFLLRREAKNGHHYGIGVKQITGNPETGEITGLRFFAKHRIEDDGKFCSIPTEQMPEAEVIAAALQKDFDQYIRDKNDV